MCLKKTQLIIEILLPSDSPNVVVFCDLMDIQSSDKIASKFGGDFSIWTFNELFVLLY